MAKLCTICQKPFSEDLTHCPVCRGPGKGASPWERHRTLVTPEDTAHPGLIPAAMWAEPATSFDARWLSGLLGAVLATSACLVLWLAGFEPPARLRWSNRAEIKTEPVRDEALLADRQRLADLVDAVSLLIQKDQRDPRTLVQDVEGVWKAKEVAEQRAAEVAQEATARAQTLQATLQSTQEKLKLAERRADEAVLEVQKHTVLKPLEKAQPSQPLQAYQSYTAGLHAFEEQRYLSAEQAFQEAVRLDGHDARFHYFLGLARLQQGKKDSAEEDFRQGARLERESKPAAVFINTALENVPRPVLQVLNSFRPRPD